MKLTVEEIIENDDNTCTVKLDMDEEATIKLIEIGFIHILEEHIKNASECKK